MTDFIEAFDAYADSGYLETLAVEENGASAPFFATRNRKCMDCGTYLGGGNLRGRKRCNRCAKEHISATNKNRYATDPAYAEKVQQANRNCQNRKCATDPAYAEKKRQANRNWINLKCATDPVYAEKKRQANRNWQNRKRAARGGRPRQAHLTEAQVIDIRARAGEGRGAKARLSREYGVADSTISNIIAGRTWKGVAA